MTDSSPAPPEWGPRYKEVAAYYRDLLKPSFRGRRWLLFGGPVVALVHLAGELKRLGGERPFLLGSCLGTGELPSHDFAENASFDIQVSNIREEFSHYESLLRAVPPSIAQAVGAWDPESVARAAGLITMSVVPDVAGRRTYGGREPLWLEFEDKTRIDEFWRAAGVPCRASEVVELAADSVRAAIDRLDCTDGAVLAGDARDGLHGGAQSVIPVWDDGQLAHALETLGQHHDRVRVMPYLKGQPCSIHGVVFPEGVSVFRPVEMVTLVDRKVGRFQYAGLGTFWDPPEADRESMRALARRIGVALRERADYRGPFTIDGVLCGDGFRPTELNSRFGAGMGLFASAIPTLPLASLCLAATEGEALDYRHEWLEEIVLEESDRRRSGRGSAWLEGTRKEMENFQLVETSEGYRSAREDETPDGSLMIGPGAIGSFVNFVPAPESVETGRSIAGRVARAFEWADRELGTRIAGAAPAVASDSSDASPR